MGRSACGWRGASGALGRTGGSRSLSVPDDRSQVADAVAAWRTMARIRSHCGRAAAMPCAWRRSGRTSCPASVRWREDAGLSDHRRARRGGPRDSPGDGGRRGAAPHPCRAHGFAAARTMECGAAGIRGRTAHRGGTGARVDGRGGPHAFGRRQRRRLRCVRSWIATQPKAGRRSVASSTRPWSSSNRLAGAMDAGTLRLCRAIQAARRPAAGSPAAGPRSFRAVLVDRGVSPASGGCKLRRRQCGARCVGPGSPGQGVAGHEHRMGSL